jgi:hypothetical protein
LIKIEVGKCKVVEADINGTSAELLADLGLIADTIIFAISEAPEDREEILDEFTRLLKGAWNQIYKEV